MITIKEFINMYHYSDTKSRIKTIIFRYLENFKDLGNLTIDEAIAFQNNIANELFKNGALEDGKRIKSQIRNLSNAKRYAELLKNCDMLLPNNDDDDFTRSLKERMLVLKNSRQDRNTKMEYRYIEELLLVKILH